MTSFCEAGNPTRKIMLSLLVSSQICYVRRGSIQFGLPAETHLFDTPTLLKLCIHISSVGKLVSAEYRHLPLHSGRSCSVWAIQHTRYHPYFSLIYSFVLRQRYIRYTHLDMGIKTGVVSLGPSKVSFRGRLLKSRIKRKGSTIASN